MSTESPGLRDRIRYWRLRFRAWRGSRPFWAGLLTMLGGVPIAYFPYANLTIGQLSLRMATTAGAGSLIIGVLLVTLGLTMWFHSLVRVFAGVAAIVLALVSIPVANFGGFVIGFLLALLGGALSVSWGPGAVPTERAGDPDGAVTEGAVTEGTDGARGSVAPDAEPVGPQAGEPEAAAVPGTGAGTEADANANGGRHRAG
ncbi:DUF6114 domain-containing protein [Streptomyces sp. URMC 123]|uniref:DUF6114 domain-containing protein n=1 Tax=Streptomyces sp. URMC 123 TaxID=3423403 RepID=UPI003F19D555